MVKRNWKSCEGKGQVWLNKKKGLLTRPFFM